MILVLDNYDSFTYNLVHLVGRYHRELVVRRNDAITLDEIEALQPDGILISPGPGRPNDAGICKETIAAFGPQTPILGVCLGHQAIAEVAGAVVTYAPSLLHGKTSLIRHDGQSIYCDLEDNFVATRYHSLIVDRPTVPASLEVSAETENGLVMGLRHMEWPVEGVQFHPESVMTAAGPRLVENWVRSIASLTKTQEGNPCMNF